MAKDKKSPWHNQAATSKDKGKTSYQTPREDEIQRGKVRKAIEDKRIEQELLNDDPLF